MTRENAKRLRDILTAHQKAKFPNIPDHCLVVEVFPDVNEKGIKKNIKQWCAAMGFKYSNTDSAATASVKIETLKHASGQDIKKVSVNYKKSEFEVGHADIEISKNNRLWCIEIKAQNKRNKYKDRQSEAQKQWQIKSETVYGNAYYICRGMDDFFDLYDNVILNQLNS